MSTLAATDHLHLARAIELAEGGRGATSPNPLVGAVDRPRRRGARRGLPRGARRAARRTRGARAWTSRPARGDDVRVAGAVLPHGPHPAVHRGDPRGRDRPRRDRLRRPDARRPPAAARASCATRASRSCSPTATSPPRPPAQPAVPQARAHRAPVGALQVGDDARRQGRDPHRRLEVDLGRGLAPARAPLARGVRRGRGRHRHRAGRRPAAHGPRSRASTASRGGSCSTPRRACRSIPSSSAAPPSCR